MKIKLSPEEALTLALFVAFGFDYDRTLATILGNHKRR